MLETIKGGAGFSYIEAPLPKGGEVIAESGAMASMDDGIEMRTKLNGGIVGALLMKFLGKETLFVNRFFNQHDNEKKIVFTKNTPGQIQVKVLKDEVFYLQPGAFIAATKSVKFGVRWAGFSSWLGGEGLFRIKITGPGMVWFGAYGAVVEKEIDGEYLVDTGHLLSYPKSVKLKLQLSGGIFSSFFGGEGFVLRLEGKGKIQMQTRSIEGLASWLNPRFWG